MADYKIQLGVKLNTKGLSSEIKSLGSKTKSKINLGVKLNTKGLSSQIRAINSKTPVRVNLNLDVRNAQSQINDIRRQIEQLGNIRINLGGNNTGGRGNNNTRNGNNNYQRTVNEATQAYNDLMSLQRRINSIRLQIGGLDASKNSNQIAELSGQLNGLMTTYNNLYNTFTRGLDLNQLNAFENEINSVTVELERLRTTEELMSRQGIDTSQTQANIQTLENRLNELRATYQSFSNGLSIEQINNLQNAFQNTTDKVSVLNAKMADTSSLQRLQSEYKELVTLAKQMSNLEIKIAGLDNKVNANEVAELTSQLNNLRATYDKLMDSFISNLNNPNLTAGILGDIDGQFEKTKNEIAQLEAKVADARVKLAKDIEIKLDNDTFANQVNKVNSDFSKLSITSESTEKAVKELNAAFDAMNLASEDEDINALIAANERYEKALKDVKNQLDINKRAEQDAFNDKSFKSAKENALLRLKGLFEDGSEAARKFGSEANKLQKELNECGNIKGINKINKDITNLGLRIKEAGVQTQTFGSKFKAQFAKYRDYISVASVFMYVTQAMKDMFEQVKLIDSAMTELKKVTDETDASYDRFLSNAASRAKEIGTTIDGLVSSTADFARLGYGFEDAQGLAEVANIYAVVGDEVEGVEGATESLISTMAAFKDEMNGMSNTDFAMGIIDKFNEIGNKFAISSGGIGEALKRSASSLNAANNTIDESIALITAANTVVQNPDKVGNAFKTISMRIRGATTE